LQVDIPQKQQIPPRFDNTVVFFSRDRRSGSRGSSSPPDAPSHTDGFARARLDNTDTRAMAYVGLARRFRAETKFVGRR
jgi:hypothetical protein